MCADKHTAPSGTQSTVAHPHCGDHYGGPGCRTYRLHLARHPVHPHRKTTWTSETHCTTTWCCNVGVVAENGYDHVRTHSNGESGTTATATAVCRHFRGMRKRSVAARGAVAAAGDVKIVGDDEDAGDGRTSVTCRVLACATNARSSSLLPGEVPTPLPLPVPVPMPPLALRNVRRRVSTMPRRPSYALKTPCASRMTGCRYCPIQSSPSAHLRAPGY